ncbi:NAD(P)H-dependent oxidoreductase [Fulvimonas sp. R45]|uniref:FMN-dependent NADH-azoreductase n=1 Tax=Fulvimonas sp. R45 TaxID=3045937 RepID=UPI00265D6CF5|nr:NAD(P)H-dependent oxidoreductase [Fulvimonas sp. R45]MDO1528687.1 NAD(P)H-dependent oxidoreductase [Fulvimonas sp. R45]
MKLLHIDSSALGQHSVSRALSARIVDQLKDQHASLEVSHRDLAAQPLPHWQPVADASDPAALAGSEALEEFLAADIVVIGAPMYNFGIPSQLKTWIDRIAVAGKTFRYTADGPEGLAGGKRVIVASSRGGIYSPGSAGAAMDFQEPYLRAVFGFLGIPELEFVRAEGLNLNEEHKRKALASAHESIGKLFAQAA